MSRVQRSSARVSSELSSARREAAERAVRLSPGDSDGYWTLARVEARACRTLFRDVASRERARRRFESAEALSRYNPMIPLVLARFLLDTGDAPNARRAAERALTLEPEAVLPRLLLAEALLDGGGRDALDRARTLFREAEQLAREWKGLLAESLYAKELLQPGAERFDRVRQKIRARSGASPA